MDINEVIKLVQSHRSIQNFKDIPIGQEILASILRAAQWTPSHHNVQAYSIIVVQKADTKQRLATICAGQKYIETCPVFLVLCAHFYRLSIACEMHGTSMEIDELENIIVGSVDTALVAQNILTMARSIGLGGVMIGGIRNQPDLVAEILELPEFTFPVMGLCLGYLSELPWQKPRLPHNIVIHEERYRQEEVVDELKHYEQISSEYYLRRTQGKKTGGWTQQMSQYLNKPRRPFLREYLKSQGFQSK